MPSYLRNGNLFAALVQVEHTLKEGKLNSDLITVILGCLAREPEERYTAARVVASLTKFIHKKRW